MDRSPDETIISRLRHWSKTSPDTQAFIYITPEGKRNAYTRKELFSNSRRAATWLRLRGVGNGDVILCLVPTSPEQTFISLGALVLGAKTICAAIQCRDGSDIFTLMTSGDVTVICVDERDKQALVQLKKYIPDLSDGSVASQTFPSLQTIIFCNCDPTEPGLLFLEAISLEAKADIIEVSPDDVATIFVTSGTSGQSKLVPKTHRQILTVAIQGHETCPTGHGDVVYNVGSFGWISGYPSQYFVFGQTRVIPLTKWSPPHDEERFLLDVLRREQVTHLFISPIKLKKLLACTDLLNADLSWQVRCVIFAGTVFRKEFSCILENFTPEIRVRYGCTETGFAAYLVYTNKDQVQNFKCGNPLKDVEIKIVDENDKEVLPNNKGQIMIKHNGHFSGYLKQQDDTEDAKPKEDWFKTGDLGYFNDGGELFVEGRFSEVISVESFLMHPQLLESRLLDCPGVHDVAVVTIPDKDKNIPCVCVVQDPRPEAEVVVPDDLLCTCNDYFQEHFMQANKTQQSAVFNVFLLFEKFPVNVNGKLQRRYLQALASERLELRNDK